MKSECNTLKCFYIPDVCTVIVVVGPGNCRYALILTS